MVKVTRSLSLCTITSFFTLWYDFDESGGLCRKLLVMKMH